MYTSKTLKIAAFGACLTLISACGNKKTEETPVEQTTTDTTTSVTTETKTDVTDTITTITTPPANEISNKTAPPVEKPVVKSDLSGKGTIVQKGDIWVIRTTGTGGTDYLPNNLDDKFKVDGKVVTFEANLLPIPKGVRMAGNPISLVSIK